MKTLTEPSPRRLLPTCLALLLISAVVLSGCGGKTEPTPQPRATRTPRTTAAAPPTAAPVAAESAVTVLGAGEQVIELPAGGAIVVPQAALPEGTQISVTAAPLPVLPEGVEPAGEAFAVTAGAEPSAPVSLRLPVPAGEADPSNLAVIRVEADAATTFLMTELQGAELVAATPGFSTFFVGRLPAGHKLNVIGPPQMLPGRRATFSVLLAPRSAPGEQWWSTDGGITLLYDSPSAAVVEAGSAPGYAQLFYRSVDVERGRVWFGRKIVQVMPAPGPGSEQPFAVGLVTWGPVKIYAGDDVRFTAQAYGDFEAPIAWQVEFGDGGVQEASSDGAGSLELRHRYESTPSDSPAYGVGVTATDARGRSVYAREPVYVVERPFQVTVEGPERVVWSDPGAYEEFAATASGGAAPYVFTFRLFPGSRSSEGDASGGAVSRATLMFDQPGFYLLEVSAADAEDTKARAVLPVRVVGGEPLSLRILDLPATAPPDTEVTLAASIRGGVLVAGGQKTGYALEVDWGDRSGLVREGEVGILNTPHGGSVGQLSHAYVRPDTYTVRVKAVDAAGNWDTDAREITIADAAPAAAPSPTAARPNTPPAAEDISTSTPAGRPVAVTLRGTDPDGDDLTYIRLTDPADGKLTGDAPFLTYTPAAGAAGTVTFTYKVNDGQADSPPATVSILVEQSAGWVLDGEPLINATDPKARLEYYGGGSQPDYFGEERFMGKFTVYRLSETLIAMDDREVDHGYEYWNITYESGFDAPPPVLAPGQVVTLTVKLSASGSVTEGMPPTVRFQYGTDKNHRGAIQPDGPVGYNPWFTDSPGVDHGSWTLTVPQGRPGDTFQVWAGWWNCEVCNVTWTYRYGEE